MTPADPETSPTPEPESPPPRKRRWLRRLGLCLLLLAGFLSWANGPGLRWGLTKVLTDQLEKEGLSGDFSVEGTALGGIAIRNLDVAGTSTISHLKSQLIAVDWSLFGLVQKQLDAITVETLHVVIDPNAPRAPKPEPAPPDDPGPGSLAKTLNLVRGLIQPAAISITDVKVTVREVTEVTLEKLTHSPGETDYLFTHLAGRDHLQRPLSNPRSVLKWTEDALRLDVLRLNEALALRELEFRPGESASFTLDVGSAELLASSDLSLNHRLLLSEGSLSLQELADLARPGLEIAGELTELELDTSSGIARFQARDLRYQDQSSAFVSLQATTAHLTSPFEEPLDLNLQIDQRLRTEGSISLDREWINSQADLRFQLTLPELPAIAGDFAYQSRAIRLSANTLDELRLKAHYQIDSSNYQAEIVSELNEASTVDPRLAGTLNFTAEARGNVEKSQHTGRLDLATLAFRQPDFPEARSSAQITWDWPRRVDIQRLQMTTADASLNGQLSWFENTLSITEIDLRENGQDLLRISGEIPAPLSLTSPEDYLKLTRPLSLKLKSQPLSLARLSSFVPIPKELSAIFRSDLTITGSPAEPQLDGLLSLDGFRSSATPELLPADLLLTFRTANQKLNFTADAQDPKGELLTARGSLPFLPRQWLDQQTIPLDTPLSLKLSNQGLSLQRLQALLPSLPQVRGTLKLDLNLEGTLRKPTLNGNLELANFNTSLQEGQPDLDLDLALQTKDQLLDLRGRVSERRQSILTLDGRLPFTPAEWLDRSLLPSQQPIDLSLKSTNFGLQRLESLSPTIKLARGRLDLATQVSGTLTDPVVTGNAGIRIDRMRLKGSPISEIRDTRLKIAYADDFITITQGQINASGGDARVRGSINLAGDEPVFDLGVRGKYVLLYRTEDFTFRGHPDLRLTGPFSKAKLSGSLEIADSLVYQDVEILPLGISRTTEIPRPNLPSFSQAPKPKAAAKEESSVDDWELDIAVRVTDPILIRGNLVKGSITGENLRVGGTIGDPRTSGQLRLQDVEADLPFSTLEVQSGVITLRPDHLTNPYLNLKGKSEVGSYLVQVYVSGEAQNPKLVLTSDPPLPESEIMLLLATGSASAQLSNQQVASQKALQYLFEGLRRRNGEKDKSVFQRLLKNSDQIELSLGETNRFNGRNFSSATLELDDHWDFTTQIDEQGQTRALVVFSVRFK